MMDDRDETEDGLVWVPWCILSTAALIVLGVIALVWWLA